MIFRMRKSKKALNFKAAQSCQFTVQTTLHLSAMVLLKVVCIPRAHLLVECATGGLTTIHIRIALRKSEKVLNFKAAHSCQSTVQMTLHLSAMVLLTVGCIPRAHSPVECASPDDGAGSGEGGGSGNSGSSHDGLNSCLDNDAAKIRADTGGSFQSCAELSVYSVFR